MRIMLIMYWAFTLPPVLGNEAFQEYEVAFSCDHNEDFTCSSLESRYENECEEPEELLCYTAWGEIPYCTKNGKCDYFGNKSCYEPVMRCNTGYSNRDCPPCY